MKYKEFVRWCNERACDGCWGFEEAKLCIWLLDEMNRLPFWKREKVWRKMEDTMLSMVVEPINRKIQELMCNDRT